MNNFKKSLVLTLSLIFAVLAVFLPTFPKKSAFAVPQKPESAKGDIPESRAECVLEVSSRRILHEKAANTKLPMASTTKILTAIMIIDDLDLAKKIEIPLQAQGVEGSSVYLKAGEIYSIEELLYGLMLRSGNDCAVALALAHSGSIEAFAHKMNEKAAYLGARDSRFCNPHGLPAAGHYTSARDLALIAAYAMENETFRTIVSTKYYAPRNYQNKNKMLFTFEGAIGVKTGFTTSAGRCLVTSAERGGMKLLSVVLDSPMMYERTAQLLNGAFEKFRLYPLMQAGQTFENCFVMEDFCYPLSDEEKKKLAYKTELLSVLPKEHGEFAGTLSIYLENSLIFSQNLYIM